MMDNPQLLTVRPGDRLLVVIPPDVDIEETMRAFEDLRVKFAGVEIACIAGATAVVHYPADAPRAEGL